MVKFLNVENLRVEFGGLVAVNNVSLEIEEREIRSLIGPNGAGKTSLFNALTGYYEVSGGKLTFLGEDLVNLKTHQIVSKGIARTFQNLQIFRNMSVVQNVLLAFHNFINVNLLEAVLKLRGQEERKALKEAKDMLEFVGLGKETEKRAADLPFGKLKLLELARALCLKPKLLLLDEPSTGLNPYETDEMINMIRSVNRELGVTVFLIEHDMRMVMEISENISVLNYGEKIAEGSPNEIKSNPKVIEAYLGKDEHQSKSVKKVLHENATRPILEIQDLSVSYGSVGW